MSIGIVLELNREAFRSKCRDLTNRRQNGFRLRDHFIGELAFDHFCQRSIAIPDAGRVNLHKGPVPLHELPNAPGYDIDEYLWIRNYFRGFFKKVTLHGLS